MNIIIIGAGGGNVSTYTQEALEAMQGAQVILGAERILAGVPVKNSDVKYWEVSRPSEVCDALARLRNEAPDVRVVILQSGDTGFYSGCRFLVGKMKDLFGSDSEEVTKMRILPGISSVQMLAARLQEPWQDWLLASGHGVSCDVLYLLMQGKKVFMLTGGELTPDVICAQLVQAGLGDLGVVVASDLSWAGGEGIPEAEDPDKHTKEQVYGTLGGENSKVPRMGESSVKTAESCRTGTFSRNDSRRGLREKICRGKARDFVHMNFPVMSVMLIDAAPIWRGYSSGIPDAEFIRGNVPMTKQEVRSVILAKLAPCRNDVVWDIGAGTGSVSVELAHQAGSVWAFEKKNDAIELIHCNRRKFCAWNLRVIPGSAPEVFRGSGSETHERPLSVETEQSDIYEGTRNTETEHPGQCVFPVPDRVLIGGSSGNLSEIIRYIARLNPDVRICVSAVLLETLHETVEVFDELGFSTDAVQVAVTRTEKVAGRRMMKAGNPVWIITGSAEEVFS